MNVAELRQEYTLRDLVEAEADADPLSQFRQWFDEACAAGLTEPNAMTLATADRAGKPSARMVLLKGFDGRGFCFFTNFESRKGKELEENPWAALVFYWPGLERQVRVEGRVSRMTDEESDAYFHSRPPGSQIAACVSAQSRVVAGREVIEGRFAELSAQYKDRLIPRPPHWGGLRLSAETIEFWQGRPNRLHDRLRYRRRDEGAWVRERLEP
jgi:pyridoxamine 5'-phosphate oxidase